MHIVVLKKQGSRQLFLERNHSAYNSIYTIFKDALKHQGEGALAAIEKGESSVCRLVPYWAWNQHLPTISKILSALYAQSDPAVEFVWGLVGDEIARCECYISGSQIDITPLQLPVQKIPSFYNAEHRYILSATFHDDTELLTELGIAKKAIEKPLEIENRGDIGERLIIAPRRYHSDLSDESMRAYIAEYSKDYNVIVLVPNGAKAKQWEQFDPTIVTKENIISATTKLKNSKGNLMVFLNRYDGLDLAGDMCRILVLDGKPMAQSLRDRYAASVRTGSPILDAQIAQTIEQGLGRAVRSGSDHCAVFILDNSLLNFLGVVNNARFFAPTTLSQIEFGLKLFEGETPEDAESALAEIGHAVKTCLTGDREWREFHKNMILNAIKAENETSYYLNLAETEHNALIKYREDGNEVAAQELLTYSDQNPLSAIDKAWYYQLSAIILEPVDPVRACDLQVVARTLCMNVLRPTVRTFSKITRTKGRQCEFIKLWLQQFATGTDVIIAIENMLTNLYYSPDLASELFEDCIYQIGSFLGFSSQRPDEDEHDGPDNLWRLEDGKHLVIEAKSQKTSERVPREDIEQLLHSLSWHTDRYGKDQIAVPILLHPATRSESNAHPSAGMRIMPRASLNSFKEAISRFGKNLSAKSPNSWTELGIHQQLSQIGLSYDQIIDKYTVLLL